jgi:hypothetical protein
MVVLSIRGIRISKGRVSSTTSRGMKWNLKGYRTGSVQDAEWLFGEYSHLMRDLLKV